MRSSSRSPSTTGDVSEPTPARRGALHGLLLAWFARHRRDLPWRRTRDPYAVWVSEAMLQQTRVETVIPYFERFLARFPDIGSLADADVDEVLACWSGLGYYRRARSLQRAAQVVRDEHGGEFPSEREAVLALPGVGPYTAGAVLSIAFDAPEPLVDGNVARVFSRWFALESELGSRDSERALWSLARALVPDRPKHRASSGDGRDPRGPSAWNQALMELGATVCTPRNPSCDACPVASECSALASGRVGELPLPKAKAASIDVELEVLWVQEGGRVLAVQRPEGGRMAGLWEFPTRELVERGSATRLFGARFPAAPGGSLRAGAELGELRHGITKHRIRLHVRRGSIRRGSPARRPAGQAAEGTATWVELGELGSAALTGMAKKVLQSPFLRDAVRS